MYELKFQAEQAGSWTAAQLCIFYKLKKLKMDIRFEKNSKNPDVFKKKSFTSILPQFATVFTKRLYFWCFDDFSPFSAKKSLEFMFCPNMANSTLSRIQSFYLTNITKLSNFSLKFQILWKLQFVEIGQNLKKKYYKKTEIVENSFLYTRLIGINNYLERELSFWIFYNLSCFSPHCKNFSWHTKQSCC